MILPGIVRRFQVNFRQFQKHAQGDLSLHSRQNGPEAMMLSPTESQVPIIGAIDVEAIGQEHCRDQRGRGDAEAHRQLLRGARDGARASGRFRTDIGIHEGVHAGELQRLKEAVDE